jgi:signal transduction histidine kinase
MLRCSPETLARSNAFDYLLLDQYECMEEWFKQTVQQKGVHFPVQYRAGDGSIRWAQGSSVMLFDDDGQTLGLLGMFNDVTEQHELEEAEHRSRILLETAMDAFPLAARIVGTDGSVQLANKAALEIYHSLGMDEGNLGCMLDSLTRVPIPTEKRPVLRALHGETVAGEEYLLHGPNGKEMPALFHAAPIHLAGETVAAISVVQDITALKAIDQAKNEFLAVLSHELRTPLTVMLGWSEIAQTHRSQEFLQQAMEVIHRNVRRQQRLIDELIDMSMLINQRFPLKFADIEVGLFVSEAVAAYTDAAYQKEIILTSLPDTQPLAVNGDQQRLQQCISHLINNSIKFTPPGGVVTVSWRPEGADAVITVQDNGRGIEKEIVPLLFQPFRQIERDEAAGGIGLGLAIVRGVIQLHRGSVSAASPGAGLGSTFTIRLPLSARNENNHE